MSKIAKVKKSAQPAKGNKINPSNAELTLTGLRQNEDLWYRIRVLLYDLRNIASNRSSEQRTHCTTDELYISNPYFTSSECALIKSTLVQVHYNVAELAEDNNDKNAATNNELNKFNAETKTVEDAIKSRLAGFFDKRKASGDSRPCGPHDMAPIYESVFGISRSEVQDKKFLARLRRSGLGDIGAEEKQTLPAPTTKGQQGKKGR